MTTIAKQTFYRLLKHSGTYRYARRSHRDHAVILTYHGVLQRGSDSYVNRNCVDGAMFEQQMRWMKKHYTLMPLSELVALLRAGRALPPYAAAVTFDDGFRNNYENAFPILVKCNVPATIFLTTDYIGSESGMLWTERVDALIFSATSRRLCLQMNGMSGEFDITTTQGKETASDRMRRFLKSLNPEERERHIASLERQVERKVDYLKEARERYAFLNWDEVRKMAAYGIEFGSHTRSHAILSTLTPEKLRNELENSKTAIEHALDRPCELFSYPNGTAKDFTPRDQEELAALGYRAALTQINGFNAPGDNVYALRRINIVRSNNFAFFLAKVTGVWGQIRALAQRS